MSAASSLLRALLYCRGVNEKARPLWVCCSFCIGFALRETFFCHDAGAFLHRTARDTFGYGCGGRQPAVFRTRSSPRMFATEPMNETGQRNLSSSRVTFLNVTPSHCSLRPSSHSGPFGHSPPGVGQSAVETLLKTASSINTGQPAPLLRKSQAILSENCLHITSKCGQIAGVSLLDQ